ncbi:MAG: MATE family efflux transporter [Thalassotalea sp.]
MKFQKYITNTKSLFSLALPILITQLISNLVGFFDTVMAGQVSATDLAAVALASSIWVPIVLTVYGLIMALTSIVAQYAGSKQHDKIAYTTIQTGWIALFISFAFIVLFVICLPIAKAHLTIEPKLSQLSTDYLFYVIWGAPCCFLFMVLRNFTEGISLTKPTMVISVIGLLLNIPLNYLFIYGGLGFKAYGGAGCGIATAIVYGLMFLMMVGYVQYSSQLKQYNIFARISKPNKKEIWAVLSVGIPIALSLLFEVSLFSVVALLLAPFGATIVASHQVALNFTGILFMIPLSIAMAVTIKVGYAIGEKKFQQAQEITNHAFITGLIIASVTAISTYLLRFHIADIYSNDIEVITLAASLMFLACLYQFSDTVQVISAGALRGYKDTQAILWITFISYWLVGLTIGYLLAITDNLVSAMGAQGFWIGFIIGLSAAAVLLFIRLRVIQTKQLTAIVD